MSANNLVNPQVSASGEAQSLAIEKFNGQVREQYNAQENLMSFFDMEEVTGTNIVSNKYIGETSVQGLAPGQSVQGEGVEFDKNALVIDASIIARNIVGQLHDVQDDINTKARLARNQIEQMKKVEDRMLVHQLVKGGRENTEALRTTPRVKGHSFSHNISMSTSQITDPWLVLCAIELAIERKQEEEVPDTGIAVALPYRYFNALRDIERIVNSDYQTFAGDTKSGFVLKSFNVPIIPSNRFPKVGQDLALNSTHHMLSNGQNGYRYDVKAEDESAICVIFGRDALIVGRSISLTGEIWRNQDNKSWYIDTFMSEGCIPDRWEHLGVVTHKTTGDDAGALTSRKARKASLTTTVS